MTAVGRPSDFSQEIADKLCEGLIEGKSLREICKADDMPSTSTVCRWLGKHEEFREQYAHARTAQADALFDEILEIADDGSNDYVARKGEEGEETERVDHDHIARSRLRVDARKWMASKLQPKKYGDKLELAGDPSAPLIPILNVKIGSAGSEPPPKAG